MTSYTDLDTNLLFEKFTLLNISMDGVIFIVTDKLVLIIITITITIRMVRKIIYILF